MGSKRLETAGFSASGGAPAPQEQPRGPSAVDMLVAFNRDIAAGKADMANIDVAERFFAICAMADTLPEWAEKPGLEERGGRIVAVPGGMSRTATAAFRDKKELRAAVDLMRSSEGGFRHAGRTAGSAPLSREAMARMARAAFGDGPFGGSGGKEMDGPSK